VTKFDTGFYRSTAINHLKSETDIKKKGVVMSSTSYTLAGKGGGGENHFITRFPGFAPIVLLLKAV
jgi:hypothetical protein